MADPLTLGIGALGALGGWLGGRGGGKVNQQVKAAQKDMMSWGKGLGHYSDPRNFEDYFPRAAEFLDSEDVYVVNDPRDRSRQLKFTKQQLIDAGISPEALSAPGGTHQDVTDYILGQIGWTPEMTADSQKGGALAIRSSGHGPMNKHGVPTVTRVKGGAGGREAELYDLLMQDPDINPMMINADEIIGKYGNLGYKPGDYGTYGDSEINQYISDANQAQQDYLTERANESFSQGAAGLGASGLMSSSAMNKLAATNQRNLASDMNRYNTQANLEGLGMWLGDKNRHYDRLSGMQGAKMGHAFNTAYQNQGADLQSQIYGDQAMRNTHMNLFNNLMGSWQRNQDMRYNSYQLPFQATTQLAGGNINMPDAGPNPFLQGLAHQAAGYTWNKADGWLNKDKDKPKTV